MKNIGFLMANKYLNEAFQSCLHSNLHHSSNAKNSMSRVRWEKTVDPYKSITFTLVKESDIFFASIKNQEWASKKSPVDRNEIVKNRYM